MFGIKSIQKLSRNKTVTNHVHLKPELKNLGLFYNSDTNNSNTRKLGSLLFAAKDAGQPVTVLVYLAFVCVCTARKSGLSSGMVLCFEYPPKDSHFMSLNIKETNRNVKRTCQNVKRAYRSIKRTCGACKVVVSPHCCLHYRPLCRCFKLLKSGLISSIC